MKPLLIATAAIELGAGLALLCVPASAALLLFGAPLELPAALSAARIGGLGLLTLGVACWLARNDGGSPAARGLATAMAIYNGAPSRCSAMPASASACTACCCGRRPRSTPP